MNFLELCQRVYDEGDRASYQIESVRIGPDEDEQIAKVIGWVKQAYKEIQLWNRHFKFHWDDGTLFSTVDGTQDYTNTGVRNLLRDSLVAYNDGATTGWELTYLTYKEWRDRFKNANLAEGSPTWFTELPNGQYRLTPIPSAIYDVKAAWYTTLDVMEVDEDEPIWDEDNHEIIVWVALRYYMSEYETPEELATRIRLGLRYERKEFLLKYLPEIEVVGTFA